MSDYGQQRRAATVGMFDGVHLGHQYVVAQLCDVAARLSLVPTVFTFARHPLCEIAPGRAPAEISTVAQRVRLLVEAGAMGVNVMRFDSELRHLTAEEFMQRLHRDYGVDALLMGFNHGFGSDRIRDFGRYREIGAKIGIEVLCAAELSSLAVKVSSSAVRNAVAEGNMTLAAEMLGRDFAISGIVGRGRGIGHTIGFPTANVVPWLPSQLVPLGGAYAGAAVLHTGERYPAMVNVGVNPTVSRDKSLKIEAHLIGYEGDLYGQPIEVGLISRLRDERRFASVADLRAQLLSDRDQITDLYANSLHGHK